MNTENIASTFELEDRLDRALRIYYRATNRGAKSRAILQVRDIALELARREGAEA